MDFASINPLPIRPEAPRRRGILGSISFSSTTAKLPFLKEGDPWKKFVTCPAGSAGTKIITKTPGSPPWWWQWLKENVFQHLIDFIAIQRNVTEANAWRE